MYDGNTSSSSPSYVTLRIEGVYSAIRWQGVPDRIMRLVSLILILLFPRSVEDWKYTINTRWRVRRSRSSRRHLVGCPALWSYERDEKNP